MRDKYKLFIRIFKTDESQKEFLINIINSIHDLFLCFIRPPKAVRGLSAPFAWRSDFAVRGFRVLHFFDGPVLGGPLSLGVRRFMAADAKRCAGLFSVDRSGACVGAFGDV